jgi:hypothetical protein
VYAHVLATRHALVPFLSLGLMSWSAEAGTVIRGHAQSHTHSGTATLLGAGLAVTGIGPGEVTATFRTTRLEDSGGPAGNACLADRINQILVS